MKDKRQRSTIVWPYHVYGDPMLAASLLQAAAGMSYGYPPNMLPQMPLIPSTMQQAAAAAAAAAAGAPPAPGHYGYGYRYAPYAIPQRNAATPGGMVDPAAVHQAAMQQPSAYPLTIPHGYPPQMGMPGKVEHVQGPASPLSTLSLSPTGSDKLASPTKPDIHNGLLMTAASVHANDSHLYHSTPLDQTTVVKTEKPKLFKPYKSE